MTHFCCPEHKIHQIGTAGLFHFNHRDTGNLIMGEDRFQFGGNIKVRFRAADQRDLAPGQLIVKSRTGKGAAISGDQQVGFLILTS